jgi:hypothetical protein
MVLQHPSALPCKIPIHRPSDRGSEVDVMNIAVLDVEPGNSSRHVEPVITVMPLWRYIYIHK